MPWGAGRDGEWLEGAAAPKKPEKPVRKSIQVKDFLNTAGVRALGTKSLPSFHLGRSNCGCATRFGVSLDS